MDSIPRKVTAVLGMVLVVFAASLAASMAAGLAVPINGWTAVTALPAARASLGVVTHGNWFYAIGGRNSEGKATANVWRGQIADDGSLSWTETQALPVPLALHASVASDDFIYVIGGWDDTDYHREVWRAQIQADGSLAGWQRDRDYPYQITLHGAVVQNGRLYVVGGVALISNQSVALNKVYYADIGAGGTLGTWQEVTSLPRTLYRMAVTGAGAKLYVSGGYDDSTVRQELLAATINADGTLGAWQASTMPAPREYHQAIMHDGRLVLLGGRTNSTSPGLARVDSASINADGSLGVWASEPALPEPLYRLGAITVRKYGSDTIYVLGGLSDNQYRASVYRSNMPPTPTATLTHTPIPTLTPTATPSGPRLRATLGQRLVGLRQLQYDILIENISSQVAYQIVVTNDVPGGTSVIQVLDGGRWQVGAPPWVVWQLGNLAPGATTQARYVVQMVNAQASAVEPGVATGLSAELPLTQLTVDGRFYESAETPPPMVLATPSSVGRTTPEIGAAPDNTAAATMTALRAGGRPVIDGDLTEWAGMPSVPLDALGHYSTVSGPLPSLADLSAALRAAWTADTLYFAAAITDDVLIGNDSSDIWEDDIIELALYMAAASRTHQFSLCVDGRQADQGTLINSLVVGRRMVSGGWTVEVAIPSSVLGGGSLASGQQYPFNFALLDDDIGGGSRGQTHLYWQSNSTYSYQPDWSTLSLSSLTYNFMPPTPTPTRTPTRTSTPTPTRTKTLTPTRTLTPIRTSTPTSTALPSVSIYNVGADVTWWGDQSGYSTHTNSLYWPDQSQQMHVWLPMVIR